MNFTHTASPKLAITLLISTFLLSACSGSSSEPTTDNGSPNSQEIVVDGDDGGTDAMGDDPVSGSTGGGAGTSDGTNEGATDDSSAGLDSGSTDAGNTDPQTTTRITFDITVPVYVSDALQVRLNWGDVDIAAAWVSDEFWTVSTDFPKDTQNTLAVTFSDNNGAITLGSFEIDYKTGTSDTEYFQISANQFDTDRWDNDNDGTSNLDELRAGRNPLGDDPLQPVQANLEIVQDKTFLVSWQPSTGAEVYRVYENEDGVSGYTRISGDLDSTTQSFRVRVGLHTRVNASYLVRACDSNSCVDSEEMYITGTLEEGVGYFKASNATTVDYFGPQVVLSAEGNTMVVGAFGESSIATGVNGNENDNSSDDSGAVYVFERIDETWQQQAYLKASNTGGDDLFGVAISLSATGDTLAIGARRENSAATGINGNQNDESAGDSGAVYVFTRSNGNWQQQAYLKASNTGQGDDFGGEVSLSGDGTLLAVSAIMEDSAATGMNGNQEDNSLENSGAVYVFISNNGVWQQEAYLKASNPGSGDSFGRGLSLSSNGSMLAVGAPQEDNSATEINSSVDDNTAIDAGAVYIFDRVNGNYFQRSYIKASNANAGDQFGHHIAMNYEGTSMVVGAFGESSALSGVNALQNDNSASESGAAYIFARDSNQVWTQRAYLKAANAQLGDRFGRAVAMSTNGSTVVIGAMNEDSIAKGVNGNQNDNSVSNSGAAYVFKVKNRIWRQQAYLKASNTSNGAAFGTAVSVSSTGTTVAVGAFRESGNARGINGNQNNNSAPNSGAVYLY